MLIKTIHSWQMRESETTSESVFFNRRSLLLGAGVAALSPAFAQRVGDDPSASLYPLKRNESFTLDRPITPESVSSVYNNYYEFGSSKQISKAAQALNIRPWEIKIDGLVDKPQTIGIDDLIAKMPLEERLYRFRCVEAWAMAVPWTGFPIHALLALVSPKSGAKYMRMETFQDPIIASGQKQPWYPWPYVEGLTIEEAKNDLAMLVTGVYGKPLAKQFGAPLRLIVPWKYGFKSVKAIKRITFTAEKPLSFWEKTQGAEYGFFANVNPDVPHARWSQASEQMIDTMERRPSVIFNGYGEQVAGLYKGMEQQKIWY